MVNHYREHRAVRTKKLLGAVGILVISCGYCPAANAQQSNGKTPVQSKWVYKATDKTGNQDNKLIYKRTEKGDRIMDFSNAGYKGGGVALPQVPVKLRLAPVTGDNTAAIQAAIDRVGQMPLVAGYRGAVLLAPGVFDCYSPLKINISGVVLKGSGSINGKQGTVLQLKDKPHTAIEVRGQLKVIPVGKATKLDDSYLPAGADYIHVQSSTGLKTGDWIRITKSVTPAWLRFMGMDHLTRNNKPQTWLSGVLTTERQIAAITGNKLTLEVPLADSYDSRYLNPPGVTVEKIQYTGELSDIGIEDLSIYAQEQSGTISQRHDKAFTLSGVKDAWVKNVRILNTVNSISVTGRRITLDQVSIEHALPTTGAAKPADINGSGTQLLFNQCSIRGDNVFYFATGARVTGPIVLLNCTFTGKGWIQPHQRWATGILIDGCKVPDGGIDFMNRGAYGSGHGWAVGWAVAWNCQAAGYLNQMPPGSANWVIGSTGEKMYKPMPFDKSPNVPEGIYDAYETPVAPKSLYLAQLKERLGAGALRNIGY